MEKIKVSTHQHEWDADSTPPRMTCGCDSVAMTTDNRTNEPTAERWRKKPVEIEARRFSGTMELIDAEGLALWCGGTFKHDTGAGQEYKTYYWSIEIPTLEGTMRATPGDYIIKGVQGEFYPCRGDIFEQTYEPAALVAAQGAAPQAESEDDREVIAKALCEGAYRQWNDLDEQELVWHYRDADSVLAAGFSRAAVPDATTEEIESLRGIAETHAFCADRLSIETERADRIAREVCDRGCSYTGGPDEECSAHGRTPRELWEFIAQDVVGRDAATERAEKAEAERDAALAAIERVRAEATKALLAKTDPPNGWSGALDYLAKKILAALDGAPEPEEKP